MSEENVIIVNKETLEIPSMRTEYSKTFYVTDTERKLVASKVPLHVQDKKGEWVDITCEIKGNKPTNCPYTAKILKDKVGYQMENKDFYIEMEIIDVKYKKPTIEGNTAIWKNIVAGVDVVMTFTPSHVQFFRVIKNKNARKAFDYRIVLDEKKIEHISFNGHDAEGKGAHFEQTEKSTKKIKRKGINLVEKVITDKFMGEVAEMDEKTRKRSWSKKVKYPIIAS